MKKIRRGDKWFKYSYMVKSTHLAPHMPKTCFFTAESLQKMITRYGEVILKPVIGSRGSGVIKVSFLKENGYEIHTENKKKEITEFENVVNHIKKKIGSRRYLIQRRVRLSEIDNRPFDIRIIVQRKKNSRSWKVTGKVAKVAGKGYIVTNITRSKGTLLTVETAIERSSLEHISVSELTAKIDQVALLSARRLTKLFPHHRIYGLDMGLDQKGHIWVIEANTSPMMSHFRKMEDKSMYRRIKAYKQG
ncbi:YheC/YheD family protein [Desmospora activa]|uniref:YheC/D-like protein n=1 Tax=Desmospora activa DSM 45169 TaxID=1121389 RepID=A0A2T4ZAM7_9BACL|nr:YheC/YheD family protein [Desmospora activa]PTM58940.1 YheC/D-like protein [Desmospora activa DSM 45169]